MIMQVIIQIIPLKFRFFCINREIKNINIDTGRDKSYLESKIQIPRSKNSAQNINKSKKTNNKFINSYHRPKSTNVSVKHHSKNPSDSTIK